MIRIGELLSFYNESSETKCRIESISKDFSFFTIVDNANALRIGKTYKLSITRFDGTEAAVGIVTEAKSYSKGWGWGNKKRASGSGMLEYTIKITKPFKKEQKRNAVRFECFLPAIVFEIDSMEKHECRILDLSAGGAKMLTNCKFTANKVVNILTKFGEKDMHLLGVVLGIAPAAEAVRGFEYVMRTKFTQVTKQEEEEIVKYIFAEYRKAASKRTAGKKKT